MRTISIAAILGSASAVCSPCYEKPPACTGSETSIQITGVTGDFCSPLCYQNQCPKGDGSFTATPSCVLETQGSSKPTQCALICTPGDDAACPAGASCQSIQGEGICTYPAGSLGATTKIVTTGLVSWRSLSAAEKTQYTYEHFAAEFTKADTKESRRNFAANLAKIHAHNAKGLSWREGVNVFTDLSADGFKRFKGKAYVPRDPIAEQLIGKFDAGIAAKDLPVSVDWRTKGAVTPVKNQGGCGSCWAFSSTETVESAVFMATGTLPLLAPQEFVDCIPNPNACGGTGGCQGSTEEYGFAWAMLYGMATEADYKYTGSTGKECLQGKGGKNLAVAGITNFVKLPSNDYDSLMQAIATVGPVSISVDASWGAYESGVYTGCDVNKTTIDHAVQLVGYGTEGGADYFLVRNSWGASWGEGGYIKLARIASGAQQCGTDTNPLSGNGCKNGAKTQKVCGACGMLSDSSFALGGYMVDPAHPITPPGAPIHAGL